MTEDRLITLVPDADRRFLPVETPIIGTLKLLGGGAKRSQLAAAQIDCYSAGRLVPIYSDILRLKYNGRFQGTEGAKGQRFYTCGVDDRCSDPGSIGGHCHSKDHGRRDSR